ncbi:DUF4468 domain-containing protein [Ferruginibacter sp. SUN002]|uniref:DUF4468 domain-containing protein n=1 Tax=Ferruginibacter sp. SUN002 TaxID=2937789 RepID=UPI003D36630C
MRKILTTALLCIIIKFSFAQNMFALNAKADAATFPADPLIAITAEGTITNTTIENKMEASNAVMTFSREINAGTQSNDRLFNKSLIWFAKSFFHSYDKILSSDRSTGIITGRTFFYSGYKVPGKTDSTNAFDYTNYNFEWTIKITNGKVDFTIGNMYVNKNIHVTNNIDQKTAVTKAVKIPFIVLLNTDEKMKNDWKLSRSYLVNNLDALVVSLNKELAGDSDLNWYF